MPKYLIWFGLLTAMLMVLSGCGQPVTNEVNLGQEITLSPGQSIAVAGENLTLKFVEIISDSRCPKGATCIWAGEVSCSLEITKAQSKFSKTLIQPGPTVPAKDTFADYEITFDIHPYPELAKDLDKKDYRLQLVVSK